MSLPRTPAALSEWITRVAASLAWRSAVDTDDAVIWTPIDRTSWSGVPETVPVPVTVIFPPAADAVSTTDPDPPGLAVPLAAAPDRPEPSKNEPMSSPAAATPIPIARG